jgi:hypothetical protein
MTKVIINNSLKKEKLSLLEVGDFFTLGDSDNLYLKIGSTCYRDGNKVYIFNLTTKEYKSLDENLLATLIEKVEITYKI